MRRFLGILQFLTRIPIKVNLGFDEEFDKGIVYFPLVGLVLGILYFLVMRISIVLFGNYIAATFTMLTTVILTGGLHLDGLGDTFDGIYSYRNKEKILEIMKDSRLGTNALLAILFLILLKIGFLYKNISFNNMYPIILMPVFGRLGSVFASYKNKSPRENGMGNAFLNKVSNKQLIITITSVVLFIIIITFFFNLRNIVFSFDFICKLYIYNLAFIPILWLLVRSYTKYITSIIGGITGDILGSVCELSELIYIIFISLGGII